MSSTRYLRAAFLAALTATTVVGTVAPAVAQDAPVSTPDTSTTAPTEAAPAPVEQAPAEQKPAEQAPAEQAPAEQAEATQEQAPVQAPAPAEAPATAQATQDDPAPDKGAAAIQAKYTELKGDGPLSAVTKRDDGGQYATFPKWGTTVVITWSEGTGAHWFSGAVAAKWLAGGKAGQGYAVGDQSTFQNGAGAAAGFSNGVSVYYTDKTGARALWGATRTKYWSLGHVDGLAGLPVSDTTEIAAGQGYEAGSSADFSTSVTILAPNSGPAVWISGALKQRYSDLGGLSANGYPLSDQNWWAKRSGYTVELPGNKTIYWTAGTGAKVLGDGPIRTKYNQMGGPASAFYGFPETDDLATPLVTGRFAQFQGQVSIFHSEATGTHWISGALRQRFWDGGSIGAFGLPIYDQSPTGDIWGNQGEYALFGGNKVILWNASVGAFLVEGKFLDALRADGDVAYYGFPNTERLVLPGRSSQFQQFVHASLFETGTSDTPITVGWVIRDIWWKLGGYTGHVGMPMYNEFYPSDKEVAQQFASGWIYCDFRSTDGYCLWDYGQYPSPRPEAGAATANQTEIARPTTGNRIAAPQGMGPRH